MVQIVQRDVLTAGGVLIDLPAGVATDVITAYAVPPLASREISSGTPVSVGVDLLRYDRKCFFLKNNGANALTACLVQATNIPAEQRTDTDWETIDSTTFATLAAGAVKSLQIFGDTRRYWRVRATSAAGTKILPVLTAGSI